MEQSEKYPKVISVVNLKGGVGKTTLCVNLAYGLAYFCNKKVLLIDLDPQANATQYLISQRTYRELYLSVPPKKKTIVEVYEVFRNDDLDDISLGNCDQFLQRIYKTDSGYLDLLASKLEFGIYAFSSQVLPKFDQVRSFIQSVSGGYEYILIDCPPTISTMLFAGLEAAGFIFVPIKPDFLSTIGLPLLNKIIKKTYPKYINRPNWMGDIKVLGIAYNMLEHRLNMARESMEDVQKEADRLGYQVFNSKISCSTKFSWSTKRTLPIFRSEPSSRYAKEIEDMVYEFIKKIEEES